MKTNTNTNIMKSEYQISAENFATRNNVKFTASYLRYDRYFPEDKDARNIYRITLSRNGQKMWFTFGQSLAATWNNEEPTLYDVLACLTKYDPYSFDNFCAEYGYDTDSRTAYRTYKDVAREWDKVQRVFGDVLDELREIS